MPEQYIFLHSAILSFCSIFMHGDCKMISKKIIFLFSISLMSVIMCLSTLHYRTFKNEKLWRDKGIETLLAQGARIEYRILIDDTEFDRALRKKLIEEAKEVAAASIDELAEELADVILVVEDITKLHGITEEKFTEIKREKIAKRGGLDKRHYVTKASYPEDHWMVDHCLKSPDQYPEILVKEDEFL